MIKIEKIIDAETQQKVWDIRHEVFVIGQNCPKEIEYEFEEESIHFIAYYNNQAAGTARIRETENGYKLERFAVLDAFRNKGIGSALVTHLLNETIPFKRKIYLHAQLTAAPLYAKHNFKPSGENFWEADIEHVKMVFEA
ncbi:MAG: GNAT family N-acetyltransferase [Bacteroidota bacterium]